LTDKPEKHVVRITPGPLPRGLRQARQATQQLVPRARMAEIVEGVEEQLVNTVDLLSTGRPDEARVTLMDAVADLRALRELLTGDRNLIGVGDLGGTAAT
jgi:hypothetical protein